MQFATLALHLLFRFRHKKNPSVVKAEGFSICESGESSSFFVCSFIVLSYAEQIVIFMISGICFVV